MQNPRVAAMLSLYWMCKNLRALPDPGAVLDMRADHYTFFTIFSSAEAEYLESLQG